MIVSRRNFAHLIAAAAVAIGCTTISQANAAAGSTQTLKTKTTDDKTASIGVPDGWTLAKGANGFVYVKGPHGESLSMGVIVIGKNAQPGSALQGEEAFAMPFSSGLKDKFTTIIDAGAAKQGLPKPDITVASQVKTKLPMCSMFLGGWTAGSQSFKFEGIICSLKPDYLGLYKNIMFLAAAPSSVAAQDRPTIEKIAGSYRVTPAMFKRMLAAYTPLPPMPPAGAISNLAPYQDPTNSDCFDYNIIRESPPWEVPMHCGGYQPG